MIERIQQIQTDIDAYQFDNNQHAENFRLLYLSKKGLITELFDNFKSCSVEEKKSLGSVLNQLKKSAENKYTEQKEKEDSQKISISSQKINHYQYINFLRVLYIR